MLDSTTGNLNLIGVLLVVLAGGISLAACVLLVLFLGTRLGLSIRATGDNPAMVRASAIMKR